MNCGKQQFANAIYKINLFCYVLFFVYLVISFCVILLVAMGVVICIEHCYTIADGSHQTRDVCVCVCVCEKLTYVLCIQEYVILNPSNSRSFFHMRRTKKNVPKRNRKKIIKKKLKRRKVTVFCGGRNLLIVAKVVYVVTKKG